jgi:hypothetical protein
MAVVGEWSRAFLACGSSDLEQQAAPDDAGSELDAPGDAPFEADPDASDSNADQDGACTTIYVSASW